MRGSSGKEQEQIKTDFFQHKEDEIMFVVESSMLMKKDLGR